MTFTRTTLALPYDPCPCDDDLGRVDGSGAKNHERVGAQGPLPFPWTLVSAHAAGPAKPPTYTKVSPIPSINSAIAAHRDYPASNDSPGGLE
jgi:hypothetical protein